MATQLRRRPRLHLPGNRTCTPDGSCYTTPGYWVGGGIYTVDIPPCPVGLPVPTDTTSTLPPLTARSCAIRNQDGSVQIVNRP